MVMHSFCFLAIFGVASILSDVAANAIAKPDRMGPTETAARFDPQIIKSRDLLNHVYKNCSFKEDKPCLAHPGMEGQSIVCVCNDEYCDEIYREVPEPGKFVAYTSSESGMRFNKTFGEFVPSTEPKPKNTIILTLDPNTQYQEIEGFGSAVTDSAAINWKSLSEKQRQYFVDSYFSSKGIEYNMIRVPIGGSDFSTHPYAYNEQPEDDANLSNYTLAMEDYEYKIPLIKAINKAAAAEVHLIGTTWSPPKWMKSNRDWAGYSTLRTKYYDTYADYHYKFIEQYEQNGIPVWGITTTNEPLNGIFTLIPYVANLTCLGWIESDMGKWIADHLGPKIRNSKYKDLKIITLDDQRYAIGGWFNAMVRSHSKVLDYVDGVATHYYADGTTPVKLLVEFRESYPNLFVINTEACEGAAPQEKEKVLFGSWTRAENYIHNILTNLNYYLVGWMDWNMVLDKHGGPTFIDNFVDSPVIALPEKNMFVKQPMFYAMGHFAKFIPRGSKRIQVTGRKPISFTSVSNVAFVTPRNTIVTVLYNDGASKDIALSINDKEARLHLEHGSITTVEFPYTPAITPQ